MGIELRKEIVGKIIETYERGQLIQAPTGAGKTSILLEAAIELAKTTKKRIIISVPNNALVRESFNSVSSYGIDKGNLDINIVIGKSNYIDPVRLDNAIESGEMTTLVDMHDLMMWRNEYDQSGQPLYYSDFEDSVDFNDEGDSRYIKDLIVHTDVMKDVGFEHNDISITNHHYLLYSYAIADCVKEDYILLIDEVHELFGVAENIFQKKFSPSYLSKVLNNMRTQIEQSTEEWTGKNTFISDIKKARKSLETFYKPIADENKLNIGEVVKDKAKLSQYASKMKALGESNVISSVIGRIRKSMTLKENKVYKREQYIVVARKAIAEIEELRSMHYSDSMNIFLSAKKAHPTFSNTKSNIPKLLHFNFWSKISGFVGVSATLMIDKTTPMYAYGRLGITLDRTLGRQAPIVYDRFFPKENIKIYLPKPSHPRPPKGQGTVELRKWAKDVANYYSETQKDLNTMIIAGSFREIDFLKEAFSLHPGIHQNITSAKAGVKMKKTIDEFTEKGGILLANRAYATGISLSKEKLEAVYILKLQYPIFTGNHWLELKKESPSKFWSKFSHEMLILLSQSFGRLQRTPDDVGEIHLCTSQLFSEDDKVKNSTLLKKIVAIAENYGVIVQEEAKSKKEDIVIKRTSLDNF